MTEQVKPDSEHVSAWDFSREIQPGVYVHDDYDFERPSVELKTSKVLPRQYKPSDHEVYDYPGEYLQRADGDQYASVRIDELGSQFEIAHAATNARGLTVGSLLTLEDHPRDDQNKEYLVVGRQLPADVRRLRVAAGSRRDQLRVHVRRDAQLTAVPAGAPDAEAVRAGAADGGGGRPGGRGDLHRQVRAGEGAVPLGPARARRTRTARAGSASRTPWAGKQWGAIPIPRIGQEVIVDFLEGDPDQPIITGRVYNAEQMPPYELPGNKTQSGIVSRSSLGGSPENFNELMFEDKKGSELVYLRAEKDYTNAVENDESAGWGTIAGRRSTTTRHTSSITIGCATSTTTRTSPCTTTELHRRPRSSRLSIATRIQIDGNHSENINGAMSVTIGSTLTENVLINYAETVGGAMELTVGAALAITVGAVMAETVGGAKAESIGGSKTQSTGSNKTLNVGKDLTESVEGKRTVTLGRT